MHKKRNIWGIITIVFIIAFDRITKLTAENTLADGDVNFIKNIIKFTYMENTGAAFSTFSGSRWLLVTVTAVVCIVIFVYMFSPRCSNTGLFWGLAVLGAGGIGNLIDRALLGYVVDFIEPVFINFATFNIADCAVTVGAVIVIVSLLVSSFKNVRKNG